MFFTSATQLICIVVCIHQAVRCEDVRSVVGYIGESVVLRSEVAPSWTLKVIRWSIYDNVTLIATFENQDLRVNRWAQFNGRLKLSQTSGDLTIENIMPGDKMKYKVHLEGQQNTETKDSYVLLDVRDKVPSPEITLLHRFLDKEKCVISLKCSSESSNIFLMWKAEPDFRESFCSDSLNATRESVMWTSFKNRSVSFSCIATDHNRNNVSLLSVNCPGSSSVRHEVCISLFFCIILLILLQ